MKSTGTRLLLLLTGEFFLVLWGPGVVSPAVVSVEIRTGICSKSEVVELPLMQTEQLIDSLRAHPPQRQLHQWHVHHTWDPSYADFNWGNHEELQEEMRKLHVQGYGWDDIGQHFTLFPDGLWMLGRDLELDPASIRGWNTGAVAVEMVGNFDVGVDEMTPLQRDALVKMSRFMMSEWKLELRFHRDHPQSGKSCPGSGLDRAVLLSEISIPEANEPRSLNDKH